MAWLSAAASVISLVGNLSAGKEARRAGLEEQAALQYQAEQDRINAAQALAVAQRTAAEERRQGDLVQSRAIALMAASGGGVTDPSNVTLLARNAGEIAYRSAVAMYKGEEDSRMYGERARATIRSGESAAQGGRDIQKAYTIRAFGDLIGSQGGSIFDRFGGGGFQQQTPAPIYDARPIPTGRG